MAEGTCGPVIFEASYDHFFAFLRGVNEDRETERKSSKSSCDEEVKNSLLVLHASIVTYLERGDAPRAMTARQDRAAILIRRFGSDIDPKRRLSYLGCLNGEFASTNLTWMPFIHHVLEKYFDEMTEEVKIRRYSKL